MELLQLRLPQTVQVAVLVHRDRLVGAYADDSLGFVGQIDTNTTLLGLDIDKADVVLRQHRVCHATYLYLDVTIIYTGYHIKVEVGSVAHPMLPEHHICFIYVETEKGGIRVDLTDKPEAVICVCTDKPIAVYEYCNLHGLWKTEL